MALATESTTQIVSDVLRNVAESSEAAPLFNMHELVDNELPRSLRLGTGPNPFHDAWLNKNAVRHRHGGNSLRPEAAEKWRGHPNPHSRCINPGH